MPDYFDQFNTELRAIVQSVWSLDEDHVMSSMQALRDQIVNELTRADNGDESDLTCPYAVISIGKFDPDDSWGLGNEAKRAPVIIWYIDRLTDRDNQAHVHGQLYNMAAEMRNDTHGFQVIGEAQLDSGETNPANAEFIDNQIALIAGSVAWPDGILIGELHA